MINSFETLEKARTAIFITSLLTLAAAACDQLENAGIPACLCQINGRHAIVVPQNYSEDTHQLLQAHSHNGEIYLYQG